MQQSDETILALLASDLDTHYELLVERYIKQLCNYITHKGETWHHAEDIVMEAFERAYLRLKGYSVQQLLELKLRAWLYKIIDNLYINFVTRRKPPASMALDDSEESLHLEIKEDSGELPERLLESAESRRELEKLVMELPSIFREVIYLHFFAELSYQEIAEIRNQKVGTVRTNVSRGLQVLRDMLEAQKNEEKHGEAMI